MIIASINPEEKHELNFDLNISGSKDDPSDIRFIIEGIPDPNTGETVQDVFTIICRAVRANDSITVYIPRLLNVFRSGSYKARLEVVLENRLFIPLSEEIEIIEPIKIGLSKVPQIKETVEPKVPEVTVSLTNVITEMLKQSSTEKVSVQEEISPIEPIKPKEDPFKIDPQIDDSWKTNGFKGLKNPFKKQAT